LPTRAKAFPQATAVSPVDGACSFRFGAGQIPG